MSDQHNGPPAGGEPGQWQPPSTPAWAPPSATGVPAPPPSPQPYGASPAGSNPYLAPQSGELPSYGEAGSWSPSADQPKKSKKGLILGITLLVLVALGASAVFGARALLSFDPQEGGDWAVRFESTTATDSANTSGVMVAVDGYAVTDAASVLGAEEIRVFLGSASNSFPGEVVGIAECSNLALVKVNASLSKYDTRPWASGTAAAGTDVFATGYTASGKVYTAAAGTVGTVTGAEIVHTAPVADGLLGGALVDGGGTILGINVGDGVAISAVEAAKVRINSSDDIGFVGRASARGLEVLAVSPDSAAATTGLRVGDIIQSAGSVSFGASDTMSSYCDMADGASGPIDLTVERGGTILSGAIGGAALAGGEDPSDIVFQTAVDDTGQLRFDVPVDWTVDGRPTGDDGTPVDDPTEGFPDLFAEGDEGYANMYYIESGVDLEAQVVDVLEVWGCTSLESPNPYDDGVYVGVLVPYGCEGDYTSFLVIAEDAQSRRVLVDVAVLEMPRSSAIAKEVLDTFSG